MTSHDVDIIFPLLIYLWQQHLIKPLERGVVTLFYLIVHYVICQINGEILVLLRRLSITQILVAMNYIRWDRVEWSYKQKNKVILSKIKYS